MVFRGLPHGKWILWAYHMENGFQQIATKKMVSITKKMVFEACHTEYRFWGLPTWKKDFRGLQRGKCFLAGTSPHRKCFLVACQKENGS